MRHKRPAALNIGIDIDPDVHAAAIAVPIGGSCTAGVRWEFVNADAALWLTQRQWSGHEFVYADPPYLMCARRRHRQLYRYEYTEADHRHLLAILLELPCQVMISGYYSDLYAEMLNRWRTVTYSAQTRGGTPATEWLWMNYPEPPALHDYRFLGKDFRERERIKRKASRWVERFQALDALERQAIISELHEKGVL